MFKALGRLLSCEDDCLFWQSDPKFLQNSHANCQLLGKMERASFSCFAVRGIRVLRRYRCNGALEWLRATLQHQISGEFAALQFSRRWVLHLYSALLNQK